MGQMHLSIEVVTQSVHCYEKGPFTSRHSIGQIHWWDQQQGVSHRPQIMGWQNRQHFTAFYISISNWNWITGDIGLVKTDLSIYLAKNEPCAHMLPPHLSGIQYSQGLLSQFPITSEHEKCSLINYKSGHETSIRLGLHILVYRQRFSYNWKLWFN